MTSEPWSTSRSSSLVAFEQGQSLFVRDWPAHGRQVLRASRRQICAPRNGTRTLLFLLLISSSCIATYSLLLSALFPVYANPPSHYRTLQNRIAGSSQAGRGNVASQKVFIAANIINADLVNGVWGAAMLELVDVLGPENVFISIYENDSGPEVAQALRELRTSLKCKND